MNQFNYYHPIEVRYGDLDPQGHVNNAKFLTYIEQARIIYVQHLGLWDGGSFKNIGIILADVHVTYKAPILWEQKIRVGVRVDRLGNKSFDFQYVIEDHSTATTIQVAYNYKSSETIPIPDHWRDTITKFEN